MTDNFVETVAHLAGGARLRFVGNENDVELVIPVKQPDGPTITRLLHRGWLESRPGCYVLSDAGKLAYLRSTDELQNVGLVDPTEYRP